MENTYRHYLNDSIKELIDMAKNSKNNDEFEKGILMGFYSAISLLLNQAEAFGISNELDEEIRNFNAESLLTK